MKENIAIIRHKNKVKNINFAYSYDSEQDSGSNSWTKQKTNTPNINALPLDSDYSNYNDISNIKQESDISKKLKNFRDKYVDKAEIRANNRKEFLNTKKKVIKNPVLPISYKNKITKIKLNITDESESPLI
jgi:hypothetical protein